ncbi:MAG: hypothetical protein M0P49_03880 [Bacilli bacterium]|nr:hypothetical protein [Bacilli bacterium]
MYNNKNQKENQEDVKRRYFVLCFNYTTEYIESFDIKDAVSPKNAISIAKKIAGKNTKDFEVYDVENLLKESFMKKWNNISKLMQDVESGICTWESISGKLDIYDFKIYEQLKCEKRSKHPGASFKTL